MAKLDCIDEETNTHRPDYLTTVYSHFGTYDVMEIVRWCICCGAIVVDEEVDGRLMKSSKMHFPQTLNMLRE